MNTKSSNFGKKIPDKPRSNDRSHLPPVIYEDNWLIAFDKPSGMLVSPDRWNKERACLADIARQHVSTDAFAVHRIDADTSGVVLFAKTKPTLRTVARLLGKRMIKKMYLAIVRGAPPREDMIVKTGLKRNNFNPGTMAVVPKGGMRTETKIRVEKKWRGNSLLEVKPITCKTHQIRAHLAHLGCAIVADNIYGTGDGLLLSSLKKNYRFKLISEKPLIGRLVLHASEISFQNPFTGKEVKIEAPIPKDFSIAIKYLDKFS